MKSKVRLRIELVLIMFLSIVIAFTVSILIRNARIGVKSDSRERRINERYEECIGKLENELKKCDIDKVNDVIKKDYCYKPGYEFYLVNENGYVISSSTEGLLQIDKDKIADGIRNYEEEELDSNIFKVTGCDSIKDGYYLYYTYLFYEEDDTVMVAGALVGAVLCFFFLIWGRISYISTIRLSVAKMTEGNLSERIACRYKNELRSLAEDINQMAESLENEDRKKNEFLTNISHDIRTPLTTILGYIEMIKNKNYDSEEALESYVSIMERKGKFLSSMLEDFFQYSKLISNDVQIEEEKLNLNELLRQIKEDEEGEFSTDELKLELHLYDKPIYCLGDAALLARVVENLLSNAKKYSKRNTSVCMKSSIKKDDNIAYGVFSISNIPKEDISKEEVSKLFERLYKRDNARKEEGSGLGLSIVKNIIKLHKGKIKGYIDGEELVFKSYIRLYK